MLNTAILIVTVLVLLVSLKRLGKILTTGSPETMLKRHEASLEKLKEDLSKPNSKGLFAIAWLTALVIMSSTTALSIYVLTNILNFV